MNIFSFEEESYHNDSFSDRSVPASSHLDPSAVISLAESLGVPLIRPPRLRSAVAAGGPGGSHASSSRGALRYEYSRQSSSPSYESKSSQISSLSLLRSTSTDRGGGVFSTFKKRLKQQFSKETREEEEGEVVLSFLVGSHAHGDPSKEGAEEEGGGMARIDVYCKSGTVCTNRVVQSRDAFENDPSLDPSVVVASANESESIKTSYSESIKTSYSLSPSAVLSSLLSTPRANNAYPYSAEGALSSSQSASPTLGSSDSRKSPILSNGPNSLSPTNTRRSASPRGDGNNMQVRRIFRRKVNMDGLRKLLEDPPNLIEIGPDIVDMEANETIAGDSRDNAEGCREKTHRVKLSGLSQAQRRFLRRQRKNYDRRLCHEEKVRVQMAHLVLSEGSIMDLAALPPITSAESRDTVGSESSLESGLPGPEGVGGSAVLGAAGGKNATDKQSLLHQKQTQIRSQIHLADIGLAILTGEIESIERMMTLLQKEQANLSDDDSLPSQKERNHPREGKKNAKRSRGREGKKSTAARMPSTTETSSRSRSLSRSVATSRRSSHSTVGRDSESDDDASLDDSEAEEIARMLQGCEIEYSFPYDFHDELEDALLAQEFASGDEESVYSSAGETEDGVARRGRARHRGGKGPKRRREIPTIAAVPTNGQGCIVLRNNGAFSVIGTLPKPLYKQLFQRDCPFPEYIALGTRGRFYVRFEDGSYKFTGPSSLKHFLDETGAHDSARAKNGSRFSLQGIKNKRTKGEIDNRMQHPFAVSSIAFGKKYDDFFLVRKDGSWEINGDMPKGLLKLLHDRRDRGDLAWVALGPNNEWCLKARNDRIWWGGVSEEVDDHLSRILIENEENGRLTDLKFIDFGVEDSFFLLHQ